MKTELIKWGQPTLFYVIETNNMVKFGVTTNWERREREYQNELKDIYFQLVKSIDFDNRWQAELIEQVVKWRLRKWVVPGRHEWIRIPINPLLGCVSQVIKELKPEFGKHEHIHKYGEDRWDYYRQIAQLYFSLDKH
jgi:predicted GIY-YIG superfamily endonuclease